MSGLLIFIYILLILLAIVLVVSVLMQEGNRAGLGAISGGAETFFGKSKAKGVQGKLQLITKIGAGAFIVLAIVATLLTARQSAPQEPVAAPEEAVEVLPEATADAEAAQPEEQAAPEATEVPAVTEAPAATEVPAETAVPETQPEATPAA